MADLHSLVRTGKRAYRRLGRGQSSTRGKTSGRGGKGQTARAGHKIRPMMRDMIKKLPKLRGHGKNRARTVNPFRIKPFALPLTRVEDKFNGGAVSLAELKAKELVPAKTHQVRLIGTTELKFAFTGVAASAGAKVAIEKAGGTLA